MSNLEDISEYMKGVVCNPGNYGVNYDKLAEKLKKLVANTIGTDKFEITKDETSGSLVVNLSPEATAAYRAIMRGDE